jgi:hypothetical protein
METSMSAQKFSKNPDYKMDEIYFVADEMGLQRQSLSYERTKHCRSPYWQHFDSGRQFRYNESTNTLDVSSTDMDRWSNSTVLSIEVPERLDRFRQLLLECIVMTHNTPIWDDEDEVKRKQTHTRKCRNIRRKS